eukprot:scaffold6173_cov46-Prasinocladus_malaysianus.AAC.5
MEACGKLKFNDIFSLPLVECRESVEWSLPTYGLFYTLMTPSLNTVRGLAASESNLHGLSENAPSTVTNHLPHSLVLACEKCIRRIVFRGGFTINKQQKQPLKFN